MGVNIILLKSNMAIAASRTQILTGEDHAIAVKREVVIDPESGVAVQVEKAVIAVDLGDGRVAVQERQRLIGVNVPTQVRLTTLSYLISD